MPYPYSIFLYTYKASLMTQMVKNLGSNAGDLGSIPGLGRSPGEGNSHPLQYSCLGNPTDRRAWLAAVYGVAKESDSTEDTYHTRNPRFMIIQFL